MSNRFFEIQKGLSWKKELAVAPVDPQEGDMYYDTALLTVRLYKNGAWINLPGSGGTILVNCIDQALTALPLSAPTLIDGHTIVTGDRVLFTALLSGNNEIYTATVSGPAISWLSVNEFTNGSSTPISGNTVRVQQGTVNTLLEFLFDGANWVVSGSHASIGRAEDGIYTDGLFTDFVDKTLIGTPVDRFNMILKQLCPQPAPTLDHESINQTGVTADLSWGVSHAIASYSNVTTAAGGAAIDVNGNFPVSGQRKGAFGTSITSKTGTLADDIPQGPGTPSAAYPANAFGSGNLGTLNLEVNGAVVQSIDLTIFGSGASTNVNGSGFTLSAATSILFPNGTPLTLFKYRTGTWVVGVADQRLGHNYVRLNHNFNSLDHYTNYYEWVNDTNATAITAAAGNLGTLNMTGSRYLSGVQYFTAGTALYGATISNAYRNLYSPSASAISYTGSNGSIPSESIPAETGPNWEASDIILTNKTFTISVINRLLGGSISASVNCAHPLKSALSGGASATITGILLDAITTPSTAVEEYFKAENIRLQSVSNGTVNNYAAQADIATGAWVSTTSIANGGANGYKDGLIYYNDSVEYPLTVVNGGNFSTLANGPGGNPDYSASSGTRYVYMKFQNNTGLTKSNFKVNLSGGLTTFVDVGTGPSANNVTMEMKFPAGSLSTATGWLDCYGDFATGQWNDGNGCRNATAGVGRALSTDWGITIGTKSIAANEYIIIRIAAASGWSGAINDLLLTWL